MVVRVVLHLVGSKCGYYVGTVVHSSTSTSNSTTVELLPPSIPVVGSSWM